MYSINLSGIKKVIKILLNQPRFVKNLIAFLIDLVICIFSVWISYYLRLGDFVSLSERGLSAVLYSILFSFPIFFIFGLYRSIFRYSGMYTISIVSKSIFIYGLLYSSIIVFLGIEGIPRTIGLIQPILFWTLIISWRIFFRNLISKFINKESLNNNISNALVYGAGMAGRQLVRAMQESSEIKIKGFLDDDKYQQGCIIDGKKIFSPNDLNILIKEKNINLILLALPSIPSSQRRKIIIKLSNYKLAVRTIPSISDLIKGKSLITDFLDLNIDDLLGRFEVEPFNELMRKNIFSKTILVTGAGGSIGSELCKQIIKCDPKKILLLEISEYALYKIHSELEKININKIELIPLIGSVQDQKRIKDIILIWKPATIYHAAAYKHVPLVEHNLVEGLKNNLFGTFYLANLAFMYEVPNFVFISTDKAVRPTNFMGATKRISEMCLQALNQKDSSKTNFSIVRFGNVLDSSGSVIPKFRDQIKNGGPITLTHPDITRYFMTINEAAQLVIQAGAMGTGGEVFLLDMGEPIKIFNLAKRMIQLSGKSIKNKDNPNGNIEIEITGLRPGEKLYEELLLSDSPLRTKHPKIFKSNEPFINFDDLIIELNYLERLMEENDLNNIIKKLKSIVADYNPNSRIVDYTFKNK
tara:strand:- start:728 stop:2653 length:1926 start_codon:yes stop_codon:yes gene_type:complete